MVGMSDMSAGFGDGTAGLDVMEGAVRYNRAIEDLIVECLAIRDGEAARVLDFGAGTGVFAAKMRDRGWNVTCVEQDPDCVCTLHDRELRVFNSLDQVPADERFDGAIMVNVLEHIEDDIAVLRVIFDRLRPGARIFIWVPAFELLYSDHDHELGHYRRYRRQTLARVLALAGFHVLRAEYRDSLGWLAALAWRLRPTKGSAMASPSAVERYDRWVFPLSNRIDSVSAPVLGKNVICCAERPT